MAGFNALGDNRGSNPLLQILMQYFQQNPQMMQMMAAMGSPMMQQQAGGMGGMQQPQMRGSAPSSVPNWNASALVNDTGTSMPGSNSWGGNTRQMQAPRQTPFNNPTPAPPQTPALPYRPSSAFGYGTEWNRGNR